MQKETSHGRVGEVSRHIGRLVDACSLWINSTYVLHEYLKKNIIHKVYVHIPMTKRSAITSLLKAFVVLCVQPPAKKDRETPKLMNVMETLVDIVCWVQIIA